MNKKRADQILVERGLAASRERARELITRGKVWIGKSALRKPGQMVPEDTEVTLTEADHPYVSRGALKLAGLVKTFNLTLTGKVALDVGASTGGFTDFLLREGVRRVFCVDVGQGQLHPSLRENSKVSSWESSDIRSFSPNQFDEKIDIIVVDVSFISLKKVVPALVRFCGAGTELVALVKPQFEVGPGFVGKGGIVKDQSQQLRAVGEVEAEIVAAGFELLGRELSVIAGGDGNQEYFIYARKK